MNNKKYLSIGVAVVVGIALFAIAFILFKSGTNPEGQGNDVTIVPVPTDEAFDVALEFYTAWLADTNSTTTDPFASGLINSTRLSSEVRTMIEEKRSTKVEGDLDPVLCQLTVPERIGGKEIFQNNTEAQVMILARGFEIKSPYQAVVTLEAVDAMWKITKIECMQGETAPEREYDFENEGYLLKSVKAPLNPEYWHLVYEVNGEPGHTLPLFFDAESICIAKGGTETVCDPSQFVEPIKVFLQADMLDNGADVRRVSFE